MRFPGQYADQESGQYWNYQRNYDPGLGSYLEQDPLGVVEGANRFGYVGGRPVGQVDPSGLAKCVYSIAKHTLTCSSEDPTNDDISVGPGGVFSGKEDCQNINSASCIGSSHNGPIPPGTYNINRDTRPEHAGRRYWRLERTPVYPAAGLLCTLGLRRCGFMLHPGSVSLGCITVKSNNSSAMTSYSDVNSLLEKEDGDNTLTVVP